MKDIRVQDRKQALLSSGLSEVAAKRSEICVQLARDLCGARTNHVADG